MPSPSPSFSLVLGFVGDEDVHKDNARALLQDLVDIWRRDHKNSPIHFVLQVDPFTTTMEELADFALTSNFKLILVGHQESLDRPEVQRLIPQCEMVHAVTDSGSPAVAVVKHLGSALYKRLILVADPAINDYAYLALWEASSRNIEVKSLLLGLEPVQFKTPTEEEEAPTEETAEMARTRDEDLDEEEYEDEEDEDLEDDEDEDEPEDDEPEDDDLEGDDDEDEEPDDEDEDEEPDDEDDDEAEDADVVDDDEEDEEDDDDLEEDDDEDEPEDEPEEEPDDDEPDDEEEDDVPVAETPKTKRWTTASLTRLAQRDLKGEFYETAAKWKVFPGKGRKSSTMVREILELQAAGKKPLKSPAANPDAPAPRKAASTAKKAPAKKVAPVAKKAPAKKTLPVITSKGVERRTAPAAKGTKSNKTKAAIKLVEAALLLLEDD